jgi:hypothetical protein
VVPSVHVIGNLYYIYILGCKFGFLEISRHRRLRVRNFSDQLTLRSVNTTLHSARIMLNVLTKNNCPRRYSNPRSQQVNDLIPTLYNARPVGPASTINGCFNKAIPNHYNTLYKPIYTVCRCYCVSVSLCKDLHSAMSLLFAAAGDPEG